MARIGSAGGATRLGEDRQHGVLSRSTRFRNQTLADTPLPRSFGAALASVGTFPRAPEQFVASPLCLVGYVRWDARSDRVPPLQTIIFSSFTGRTPVIRLIRICVKWRVHLRAKRVDTTG